MSEPYRVVYSDGFARDLQRLDRSIARRVVQYLAERVDGSDDPRRSGRALVGSTLGSLWRYRVADFRVIVDIQDGTCTVLALHAAHRSKAYD